MALAQYQILDTAPDPDFTDVAELAAAVCETPLAAISFVDENRQWFKAEVGLGIKQTPSEHAFCLHTVGGSSLYVVPDAKADPLFADNPLVNGDLGLRFYAGMPLLAEDGTPIGALCVFDRVARQGLTDHQSEALRVLGRQLERQLALRRAIRERDEEAALQQATSERLRWLANHDPLTGLPNRALLYFCPGIAIDAAKADGTRAALLVLDLDHFKLVNDRFGHDTGDSLLREVGQRLRGRLAPGATVARHGGDEFAAIITGIHGDADLSALLEELVEALRTPLESAELPVDCRSSIGVAYYPDHAGDAEALMKAADLALLAAKTDGRDRAVVFKDELAVQAATELAMLAVARAALDNDLVTPSTSPSSTSIPVSWPASKHCSGGAARTAR